MMEVLQKKPSLLHHDFGLVQVIMRAMLSDKFSDEKKRADGRLKGGLNLMRFARPCLEAAFSKIA